MALEEDAVEIGQLVLRIVERDSKVSIMKFKYGYEVETESDSNMNPSLTKALSAIANPDGG